MNSMIAILRQRAPTFGAVFVVHVWKAFVIPGPISRNEPVVSVTRVRILIATIVERAAMTLVAIKFARVQAATTGHSVKLTAKFWVSQLELRSLQLSSLFSH